MSAEFDADAAVRAIVSEAGLPDSDRLLLRRELTPDGQGRAFVEDEPASVRTLARIGERLVAIHGQSSEQELIDAGAALELLDAFAKAGADREATAAAAARWSEARDRLAALETSQRQREERLEMLDFQIREIESVAPTEAEEGQLPLERERLLHADRIRGAGETALNALSEAEGSAADRLGEAARAFADLAAIDPRLAPNRDEAEDLKRRIADLAAAARDAAEAIESDPSRLTAVETRLEQLSRLRRKFGATVTEILARLGDLKEERSELSNVEDALERRRRDAAAAGQDYRAAAGALSARRRGAAGRFSSAVEKELQGLALEKARIRVELDDGPRRRPARQRRSRRRRFSSRRTRGNRRSRWRRSPPAASSRGSSWRSGRSPRARAAAAARSSSTRSTPGSAGGWRKWSGRSSAASRPTNRSSA